MNSVVPRLGKSMLWIALFGLLVPNGASLSIELGEVDANLQFNGPTANVTATITESCPAIYTTALGSTMAVELTDNGADGIKIIGPTSTTLTCDSPIGEASQEVTLHLFAQPLALAGENWFSVTASSGTLTDTANGTTYVEPLMALSLKVDGRVQMAERRNETVIFPAEITNYGNADVLADVVFVSGQENVTLKLPEPFALAREETVAFEIEATFNGPSDDQAIFTVGVQPTYAPTGEAGHLVKENLILRVDTLGLQETMKGLNQETPSLALPLVGLALIGLALSRK